MRILLSDHFNYKKLLRFTLPSMVTLVFTSIYGVVDGFFVSNYVGKTPFTAVNFIMPFLMMLGCAGFMFGTGGGALIAMTLGQGKKEKAVSLFSLIVYVSGILGIVLAVLGFSSGRYSSFSGFANFSASFVLASFSFASLTLVSCTFDGSFTPVGAGWDCIAREGAAKIGVIVYSSFLSNDVFVL